MAISNKEWYDNIFKNGLHRSDGMDEIAESDPLDWERLRVLKDGKLVPFMPKDHIGALDDYDIEFLRSEAKKGNVFFYRMGEVYPHHLTEDGWYSTDPDVKDEKRPELQLPEAPKESPPFPYQSKLEEALKNKGLPANATHNTLKRFRDRELLGEILFNLNAQRERYEKTEQETYQTRLQNYEAERTRLTREHKAKLQAWEKRVAVYGNLNTDAKSAIRGEVHQRKVEISQNQETQRVADFDRKVLMEWYHKEFRVKMVQPRVKAFKYLTEDKEHERLAETEGIDWSRMRIWDGKKFTGVLPVDHKGPPTVEALKNLRDAAQSGNLFMYQPADTYPSKWMGNQWRTMNKEWIDKLKPKPVQTPPNKPQFKMPEPREEDFMRNVSSRKLAIHNFFGRFGIKVYQSEKQKYHDALMEYQKQAWNYKQARDAYNQKMEAYNEETRILQNEYDQKLRVYKSMLGSYDALTPQQKAAMEQDVKQREKEIKRNKEVEQKKADAQTEKQRNDQVTIKNVEKRIDSLTPQPQKDQFFGGAAALGQEVYQVIAPNGYKLPTNSKITTKDAAAIHLALAGSTRAMEDRQLSPMSPELYGQMLDGLLYDISFEKDLRYIAASYGAAKEYIAAYNGNNPEPLGRAMGEGLRNLINVSHGYLQWSPEMAGLAKVAERIFDVLNKDKALLDNCGLKQEEMDYAKGLVNLGKTYNDSLEAHIGLTEHIAGAKTFSNDELVVQTVDLVVGKAMEHHLTTESEETKMKTVENIGKGNTNAIGTVKTVLASNEQIQKTAAKLSTSKTDINQLTTETMKVMQNELKNLEENTELRDQVIQTTKASLQEKELETTKISQQQTQLSNAEKKELEVAKRVLVAENPNNENLGLEDESVRDKLFALKEAQSILRGQRSMKGNGEAQKPALDDDEVVKNAALRTEVRKLIMSEDSSIKDINSIKAHTVDMRIQSLERAQDLLKRARKEEFSLTSLNVVELEKKWASRQKQKEAEEVQATDVYNREGGTDRGATRKALETKGLQERIGQLKAARAALGEGFATLPLNDMKVIQKDYEKRGIDPLRDGGIVEFESLSPAGETEYKERKQAIVYLKLVNKMNPMNKDVKYTIHDNIVARTLEELRAARAKYESSVDGAQKNRNLSDPVIGAMNVLNLANKRGNFGKMWKEADVQRIAEELKGKNEMERKQIGAYGLKLHNENQEIGKNIGNWQKSISTTKKSYGVPGMRGL